MEAEYAGQHLWVDRSRASESWCDVCVVLSSSQCAGSSCLRFTILSGGNIRDELAANFKFLLLRRLLQLARSD
jgi:hypothetical protein